MGSNRSSMHCFVSCSCSSLLQFQFTTSYRVSVSEVLIALIAGRSFWPTCMHTTTIHLPFHFFMHNMCGMLLQSARNSKHRNSSFVAKDEC